MQHVRSGTIRASGGTRAGMERSQLKVGWETMRLPETVRAVQVLPQGHYPKCLQVKAIIKAEGLDVQCEDPYKATYAMAFGDSRDCMAQQVWGLCGVMCIIPEHVGSTGAQPAAPLLHSRAGANRAAV